MRFLLTLTLTMLCFAMSFPAIANPITFKHLVIEDARLKMNVPNAKVTAGFMKISNTGSEDDRLIDAKSDIAKRVEIHEMSMTDGIMKMRKLEKGLDIKAGETVFLKPGGFHIMVMGLNRDLTEGETIKVTLIFEKAGEISLDLPVKSMMGH